MPSAPTSRSAARCSGESRARGLQFLQDELVLLIRHDDQPGGVGAIRILHLAMGLTVVRKMTVAQDRKQPCLEIRALLEAFRFANCFEDGVLHQVFRPGGIASQRHRERTQIGQESHDAIQEILIDRFRMGPDDLGHTVGEAGQLTWDLGLGRITVKRSQLHAEVSPDAGVDADRRFD
jgi:hypothetical protein